MKCKWAVILCSLLILFSETAGRAEEAQGTLRAQVLVVYPQEADLKDREDSISGVAQILLSLGLAADYAEGEALPEDLSAYEGIIWGAFVRSERMHPERLKDYSGSVLILGSAEGFEDRGLTGGASRVMATADYPFENGSSARSIVPLLSPGLLDGAEGTRGTLDLGGAVYPLCAWRDGLRYVALTDYTTEFAKTLLAYEISQWHWPYQSRMHTYTSSLCIDEVYPFTDLERLSATVSKMVKRKLNFTLCVMPIYQNTDYPAMERFCEVLRFAQANGGSVILHAPIVQNGLERDEIAEHLTAAMNAYLDHDVYPLALAVPSEWLFSEETVPLLGRHRTLFLLDMDAFQSHRVTEYSLRPFLTLGCRCIMPAVSLDRTSGIRSARYSSAVYLNLDAYSEKEVDLALDLFCSSPFPIQDLWSMDQAVYMNDGDTLLWENGVLTVNGEQRFNTYYPAAGQTDHDYKRNAYYRFVADLKNQNQLLIGFSAVMLVVFILLGIRSRRQMHRRFLMKTGPGGTDENRGA